MGKEDMGFDVSLHLCVGSVYEIAKFVLKVLNLKFHSMWPEKGPRGLDRGGGRRGAEREPALTGEPNRCSST